ALRCRIRIVAGESGKRMARISGINALDFERALDEFFDELLIAPWRRSIPSAAESETWRVVDLGDRYEVSIAMHGVDPREVEVEIDGQRLLVRAPAGAQRRRESTYTFIHKIDGAGVTARWIEDTLNVTLPKEKP